MTTLAQVAQAARALELAWNRWNDIQGEQGATEVRARIEELTRLHWDYIRIAGQFDPVFAQ